MDMQSLGWKFLHKETFAHSSAYGNERLALLSFSSSKSKSHTTVHHNHNLERCRHYFIMRYSKSFIHEKEKESRKYHNNF